MNFYSYDYDSLTFNFYHFQHLTRLISLTNSTSLKLNKPPFLGKISKFQDMY
jgi:hypothetical protein